MNKVSPHIVFKKQYTRQKISHTTSTNRVKIKPSLVPIYKPTLKLSRYQQQVLKDYSKQYSQLAFSHRDSAPKGSENKEIKGTLLFTGSNASKAILLFANQLGVSLYRIDSNDIVGKNMTETNTNVSEVLNCEKQSSIILWFDEADALFGKRQDVQDSHDRYANVDTNFLLEQLNKNQNIMVLVAQSADGMTSPYKQKFDAILNFP